MSKHSEPTDGRIDTDEADGEDAGFATDGRQPAPGPNGQDPTGPAAGGLSRRGALAALTGLGALGLGSGTASAGTVTLEFDDSYSNTTSTNAALRLINQDTSGIEFGLDAKTDSITDEATGVRGVATAGQSESKTGKTFGVKGISHADGGRGVFARAMATSGSSKSFGIIGWTDSSVDHSTGVLGKAPNSSGKVFGIKGTTKSTNGIGALGQANADSGSTIGVIGRTQSDSTDAKGVLGVAPSTSGTIYGVLGRTKSSEGTGVKAVNTQGEQALKAEGDARVTGDVTVNGEVTIDNVGGDAYLSSNQTITTANSGEKVEFDTGNTGTPLSFNGSGTFTAQSDGVYLVTTQVTWEAGNSSFSQEDTSVVVNRNGNSQAKKTVAIANNNENRSISVSKTLRNVSVNDTITVEVQKDDTSNWDLLGTQDGTWIEITKVA